MDRELQSVAFAAKTGADKRIVPNMAETGLENMMWAVDSRMGVRCQRVARLEAGVGMCVAVKVKGKKNTEGNACMAFKWEDNYAQ